MNRISIHALSTARLLAGMMAGTLALEASAWAATIPEPVASFLEVHCYDCHDDFDQEGDLNLLDADFDLASPENFALWQHVYERLERGEMPPKKKPRPPREIRNTVERWLAEQLIAADRARRAEEGRVRFRRLNRVEYEETLRDLLKLPGLEIKERLPPDAEAHGFDNVGSALRVSYVQMGRYLEAARSALKEAARLAPQPERFKFRIPFTDIHRFRITYDLTTVGKESVLLRQPNTAQTPWRLDSVEIPFPGTHTIRIRGRAVTYSHPAGVEAKKGGEQSAGKLLHPERVHVLSIYQGSRLLGTVDLTAEPEVRKITARLHPREQIILYVPTLQDWNPKWKKGAYTGPAVALEWLEIEGPEEVSWPSASYRVLFGDLPIEKWTEDSGVRPPEAVGNVKAGKKFPKVSVPHKNDRFMVVSEQPREDAERLMRAFMKRTFRRPVPKEEADRYLDLVKTALENDKPFHEAMIDGYVAVLCSPDFLYFFEEAGVLDDFALASRLSYFLWRSMPDDQLLALASSGKLAAEEVLAAEVDRLLGDPKAQRFIEDFTGQWLDLREILATQPDEELYPEFDDHLLESMVAETHAFFAAMVERNLPARTAIDGEFVFANEALAELYGLEGVKGVALREVKVPPGNPRGGMLTQASVLKVTANGTTTSPVIRGTWVLERLLGTPPQPPPPSVPAIEPDTRGATTIRELLAKHRADPSCAECHAKIDPPGFALESFDVIGGWRDHYRSLELGEKVNRRVDSRPVSYKAALPVDPSGELADGRAFSDIHAFKEILLADERQLARSLTERLVVFATGAGVSFADRLDVEAILDRTRDNDFGVRDLIHGIVQSDLFRKK